MSRIVRMLLAAVLLLGQAACTRSGPSTTAAAEPTKAASGVRAKREIHITGVVQAVHSVKLTVPMIQGNFSNMTLTQLIANGSQVKEGDLIATFDPTQQLDAARDAKAKFEDLGHQTEQRIAENRANAEKRAVDLRSAEADLNKAKLELSKRDVLGTIEVEEDEAKLAGATVHRDSLKKSNAAHEKSEAAGLRILELQRDRQKIYMQRAEDNVRKLEIHAPLAGMVAHEFTYRGGSYGRVQVGDQLYRSYPIASIFDPSQMQVRCSINEPDILAIQAGTPAFVTPDAYPELSIPAHFVYASPVASGGLGSSVKSFVAVFLIDKRDSHLMPDLSAAVVVTLPDGSSAPAGGSK